METNHRKDIIIDELKENFLEKGIIEFKGEMSTIISDEIQTEVLNILYEHYNTQLFVVNNAFFFNAEYLISYFESLEEYEKCGILFKLKERVKEEVEKHREEV
jgi:hypothetical protein